MTDQQDKPNNTSTNQTDPYQEPNEIFDDPAPSENIDEVSAESVSKVTHDDTAINKQTTDDVEQNMQTDNSGESMADNKQAIDLNAPQITIKDSTVADQNNNVLNTQTEKPRSSKGLSILALSIAVIALGANGFLFYKGLETTQTLDSSIKEVSSLSNDDHFQASNILKGLQESQAREEALAVEIVKLQTQVAMIGSQSDQLNKLYQELIQTRFDWLVSETEFNLNLANQQLQVADNVPTAILALENIQNRLSQFDQPELMPIKQAIAQDLVQLKQQPQTDIAGLSAKLDTLNTIVPTLPDLLASLATNTAEKNAVEKVTELTLTGNAENWWENLWEKTKSGFSSLVEVRHLDSNDVVFLSPEQSYFVKENIKLQLNSARLALLQHQNDAYQSNLNAAERSIEQYFDLKSPITQTAVQQLKALKEADLTRQPYNLSTSLQAVQNYQKTVKPISTLPMPIVEQMKQETSATASAPEANESKDTAQEASAPKTAEPVQPKKTEKEAAKIDSNRGQVL
ncbi:uroporphyrinogen-III C-methyltransferase [Neisseria sp. Ec49-e6-T10]|uniref:uroporphyrinogen-III C-methyltransferase n=1 Tax=Neisseria sp. Ec49-e6-T10 TaxID=3140744 RepID=UPI003EC01719